MTTYLYFENEAEAIAAFAQWYIKDDPVMSWWDTPYGQIKYDSNATAEYVAANNGCGIDDVHFMFVAGRFPSYIGTVAVDVVGVIHKPTGSALQDADGNSYPEMAPIPGWHINLSGSVPELAAFEIDPPTTPTRVFAGE